MEKLRIPIVSIFFAFVILISSCTTYNYSDSFLNAIGIILFLEIGTIIAFVVEQNLWGFVFITMALMLVLYRLLLKRKQIRDEKNKGE